MKTTKSSFIAAILGKVLLVSTSSFAADVDLTVEDKTGAGTIDVDITVSDPVGIAGAAFTITYDPDVLEISRVRSRFFDTFAEQFVGTSASGLTSVPVDGTTYDQPLISNDVAGAGMMRIAAARAVAEDNSSNDTLFTLSVTLKEGMALGTYPDAISIVQTELSNTDAGYSSAGEAIPYLIGAIADETVLADAFPEIAVDQIDPGDLTYLLQILGDVDGLGSVEITDVLMVIDIIFGVIDPTWAEQWAANVDATNDQIDITDLLGVIDIIFGN